MYHAQVTRSSTTATRHPSWQKLGHLILQESLSSWKGRELEPAIGFMTVNTCRLDMRKTQTAKAYRWVLEASGSPINSKKLA